MRDVQRRSGGWGKGSLHMNSSDAQGCVIYDEADAGMKTHQQIRATTD